MRAAPYAVVAVAVTASLSLFAQPRSYIPSNVTGQLALARTVDPGIQVSQALGAVVAGPQSPEISNVPTRFPHPPRSGLLGATAPWSGPRCCTYRSPLAAASALPPGL